MRTKTLFVAPNADGVDCLWSGTVRTYDEVRAAVNTAAREWQPTRHEKCEG